MSATTAQARGQRGGSSALGSTVESRWLLWPPLIFFGLALGLPMLAIVIQSFETGGSAFVEIWQLGAFAASLGRTFFLALIVTILTTILGVLYAVGLSIAPRWLRFVLLAWLFLSLWTSVMVRTFGWMLLEIPRGAIYWFLNLVGLSSEPLDIYQTAFAAYPAMVAVMLPFAVLPVITAINALDREQLNAAVVFGAGPLLTMRTVILPALTPAMISGAVLIFVMSLGFYVTPLLLGGPSNLTISGIINTQVNAANRPDLGAAISLLLVAATVLIYLTADKLFKVSERWG